jgi:TRAP-type C4-dicarboxylate transport system substrate-binding protein
MRKSVVIGGVLAVLVLSWAVAGTSEAAYKPEYKASIVVGPAGPWGEAAIRFADLLKERTQGRINVKNYHAGQLFAGRQTNEFTLLVQSVGDFAFGSTINWSPQVKELNLFAMPFMYPSYNALDAVQAGEPGKKKQATACFEAAIRGFETAGLRDEADHLRLILTQLR